MGAFLIFPSLREQIAAILVASWHAEEDRPSEWALQFVITHGGAEHDGDCTDQIHSCLRCEADAAKRDADAILALVSSEMRVDENELMKSHRELQLMVQSLLAKDQGAPRGCQCPPGSGTTCQGPICPRRPVRVN